MPIPPSSLAAFANRKNARPEDEDEEMEIDEVDVAADDEEDADEDADDAEEEPEEDEAKEVDVDAIGEKVENGEGDEKLMQLAAEVDEENNPPSWALDEDIWEKAKEAVEPNWDTYSEPYAVVSHVYEAMGGTIE